MKREFLLNVLFLVGINALIKPMYIFGIDRGVQNALPSGAYGYYFALFNFVWLFQIVNDFGVSNFNSRNLSQNPHLSHKYFPNLLVLKGWLSLVFALTVGLMAALWGHHPLRNALLWYILLNQVLNSLLLFLRSTVAGLGMYRTDSALSAMDRLLVIVVCGSLLWIPSLRPHFRLEYFVWAQTLGLVVAAGLAWLAIRSRLKPLRLSWNPAFVRLFFRRSLPYALVVFLMTAYTRIDAVMIERMLPDGRWQADVYAAAYRLLDAANILGYLFAGLLLPMFARLLRAGEPPDGLAHLAFRLLWTIALPLVLTAVVYRQDVMQGLYTRADAYYGRVLGILIWSFLPTCGMYVHSTLLTANESLGRMNRVFAAGLALNVALNAVLIPTQQAAGAALATVITQLAVWIGQMWLLRQELGIAVPLGTWGQLLALAGLLLAWLIGMRFGLHLPWLLAMAGAGAASLLGAWGLRLVRFSEWREMGEKSHVLRN